MKPIWRKTLKGLVFTLAALATLIALAVAVENYRGKRAWEACKAEFEARGEKLEWSALAPPPVPDNLNFYKTPLLAPLSDFVRNQTGLWGVRDSNAVARLDQLFAGLNPIHSVKKGTWRLGESVDLAAWQTELRLQTNSKNPELTRLLSTPSAAPHTDLLSLIGMQSAQLEEIRVALRRPHAQIGIGEVGTDIMQGSAVLLPHLAMLRNFARTFQVRALAELAAGNVDAASEDVLAIFRLARSLESEPLLIATLVALAILETSVQPLWEGLLRHQWQEQHLATLSEELARFDVVALMARSLRVERACCLAIFDGWRRRPSTASGGSSGAPFSPGMPSGWIRLAQATIARMFEDTLVPLLDTNRTVVDIRQSKRLTQEAQERLKGWLPYKVLARTLLPALGPAVRNAANAQTTVNQARLAVALERYRLAQGRYPAQLDVLVPLYLPAVPRDAVNGEPYVYRQPASDRFMLYSVGLNLQDDGGVVALTKQGSPATRVAVGDWVWQNHLVTHRIAAPSGN